MTASTGTNVDVPKYLLERERAQRRDSLVQGVALAAAVGFVVVAAAMLRPINEYRRANQLVTQPELGDVPPKYALITAMAGSFRGLAVDWLWMRADKLKEEGKYYESNQLAEWICDLQPRFAAVWQYQAWNLAYNISVATHTPEERWQWVYNGVRLLRDRGIPNNPRVVGLYKDLSWIIFHKIGDMLDDMHWYYKREWAAIFENLLGPPPLGGDAQAVVDAFRPVAEAPATWSEFVAKHPDVETYLPALRAAGVDVRATSGPDDLRHPLEVRFFNRYGLLIQGLDVTLEKYRAGPRRLSPEEQRFVDAYKAMPPALADALVAYLRAKVLREHYRMDPAFMLTLMTSLIPGKPDVPTPLDWRQPFPHAIYWSRKGVELGRQLKNYSDIDILNSDRLTLFGLQEMCKRGRMVFEIDRDQPNQSFLTLGPDLRMVEPMHQMYLALGKVHADKGEKIGDTAGEMLRSGHVNTLEQAIVLFYARGQYALGNHYLSYLRDNYKEEDGTTKKRYLVDLETFALREMSDMSDAFKDANALIRQFISGAIDSLAEGDGDAATAQLDHARQVWTNYQKDKSEDAQGRRRLFPFDVMLATALYDFLRFDSSLLRRAMVWDALATANRVRQMVYADQRLVDWLRGACEDAGLDPAKAFPEPPGMDEYRKNNPRMGRPEDVYLERLRPADASGAP